MLQNAQIVTRFNIVNNINNNMPTHPDHHLKFNVKETSKGYLAQGVEIPAIIIESPTEDDLKTKLTIALDCYFKSFPEEHDKLFNENQIILPA